MAQAVTARAPSSVANLGPGFDTFGLAVNAFYDEVTLVKTKGGVAITADGGVPTSPNSNTAGIVVSNMKRRFRTKGGVDIIIRKGVPVGSGMGSSAASAAAAAVAFDRLYGLNLGPAELVELAGSGEKASAGAPHYDNAAAAVLGGFVIVRTDPLDVIRIEPPQDMRLCIAIPKIDVPKNKTKASRGLLPRQVSLRDHVANLANASAMVAGFAKKNTDRIGGGALDVVAEPARRRMIPGFDKVRQNALRAGAIGVAISGAGPSVVAFSKKSDDLEGISAAMAGGFESAGIECMTVACNPTKGASIRKRPKAPR